MKFTIDYMGKDLYRIRLSFEGTIFCDPIYPVIETDLIKFFWREHWLMYSFYDLRFNIK